jgi:tetratricopeptide (TPR) repeat protein
MLRTLLYVVTGLCATWALIAGAIELRAREDSRRLTREAEQVLRAPLRRAPELSKIDARRAVALLEQAIAAHDEPHTHGVLSWAIALEEYQKGRLEPADHALVQAEKRLPRSPDLEALGAAIAMRAGRTHEASARVAEALALKPQHPRARVIAADLAADAGQTERALALLQGLIDEEPEIGALYNRRGLAQEALGNDEAALADFERAAIADPSLPQPHINIGRLLREQGRSRDAERAFGLAIERAASDPEGWLGRGLMRVAVGDLEGGRLDIQQARELGPAEPAPLIALGDLDAWHGRLEQAIERYRAALALAGHDALAWLKLGNALARKRNYTEARASFERAIELRPDLAAAHNGLGAALLGQGDRAAAERAFATAATLDSGDPNPVLNLALLHGRTGRGRTAHGARTTGAARYAIAKN